MQRIILLGFVAAVILAAPAGAVDVCNYRVRYSSGVFCPVHTGATVCLSQSTAIGACDAALDCYGGAGFFCQARLEPISGPQRQCAFTSVRPRGLKCFQPRQPGPVNTPTETALPQDTPTQTPTATGIPTGTATATATETETSAVATATETQTALATLTPSATATETETAVPTDTATAIPTGTASATVTETAVATLTGTPTDTATPLATSTATATETIELPTGTPTGTTAAFVRVAKPGFVRVR